MTTSDAVTHGIRVEVRARFLPERSDVDAGTFELRVKTVPGTRLEETEKLVARIENSIKEVIPESEIETIDLCHRDSMQAVVPAE